MALRIILFNFKGKKPQQCNSETVEHLSTDNRASTCQSVQQTQSRARKHKATQEQAQLSPVTLLLITFV